MGHCEGVRSIGGQVSHKQNPVFVHYLMVFVWGCGTMPRYLCASDYKCDNRSADGTGGLSGGKVYFSNFYKKNVVTSNVRSGPDGNRAIRRDIFCARSHPRTGSGRKWPEGKSGGDYL